MCWGPVRFFEGGREGFYAVQLSPTCRYEVTRVLGFRNPSRGSSPIQSSEGVAIVPLKKHELYSRQTFRHSVTPPPAGTAEYEALRCQRSWDGAP